MEAAGAIPDAVPMGLPSMVTATPALPAAVDAVCEPCPEPSRAERNSSLAMFCFPKPSA